MVFQFPSWDLFLWISRYSSSIIDNVVYFQFPSWDLFLWIFLSPYQNLFNALYLSIPFLGFIPLNPPLQAQADTMCRQFLSIPFLGFIPLNLQSGSSSHIFNLCLSIPFLGFIPLNPMQKTIKASGEAAAFNSLLGIYSFES